MTSKTGDQNLNVVHSIYVTLDSLLDTRLGTIALLDEKLLEKTLKNGYVVREEENFPPLKKKTFLELYKTRDVEVLKTSPMTICVDVVAEMAMSVLTKAVDTPIATSVQIVINIFPYRLNEIEVKDLITSFVIFTKKFISVKVIRMSERELTPAYCKNAFHSMIMYNYDEWLDVHAQSGGFKNIPSSKLVMFGPKIFFNRKPTDVEKREMARDKIDPFKLIEEVASTVVSLKLLDISVFSVDIDRYIRKDA